MAGDTMENPAHVDLKPFADSKGVTIVSSPPAEVGTSANRNSEDLQDGQKGQYRGLDADGNVAVRDGAGAGGDNSNQEAISDDDPAAMDERKQKRMLSNRESARRSRLRKQQHLDELRQQVAQLRGENNEMLNKFNIASRHFGQLTEENRALRAHAMDLSHRLQHLHHTVAAHGHPGSRDLGLGLSHLDTMPLGMVSGPMHHPMAGHPHHQPGPHLQHQYNKALTPELSR